MCRSKHVEPSINFGIINSITKLHLVGISTELELFLHFVLDLYLWCLVEHGEIILPVTLLHTVPLSSLPKEGYSIL